MLAYAANAPRHAERTSSPNGMLLIIAAHVAVIAAVMSAKMDLPHRIFHPPTTVTLIPEPDPPPAHPIQPRVPQPPMPQPQRIDQPQPIVPTQPTSTQTADATPTLPTTGETVVTNTIPQPQPTTAAVRSGPRLLTPASELKPPYPPSKLLTEEEAVLTLRLSIDEHGRVVAVDPVGRADPAFLDAARRHLLAHWRFKPAMEDGRAVVSSEVVTLHFELDG